MKTDIILCGVGGQGILSIATVIGQAATQAGIYLKQAEVHGMSQRGGDVQSNLRLGDERIWSDLIPLSGADLVISMEPMEALRYLPYLAQDGVVISASAPFVNIPDYPDKDALFSELSSLPHSVVVDIDALAREAGSARSANMVLLGAASSHIGILSPEQIREAIATVFARKGEDVVNANVAAFNLGLSAK